MPRSNHYDLLLCLLERAASRDGLQARDARTRCAGVEALEAEALIERHGGVFRATAAGTKALNDRGRRVLPAGDVAVLFTDMEGATQLIERFGELEAHALLQRHFAVLRASLAEHRGHEIKSLGDGLMVVFDAVADAVACAAQMQAAVSREEQALGLRIGIHVGEPMREEGDYFGTPVIIARRLCDTARPGQTLVSESVSELAAEHEFDSFGDLALKGLSKRVSARALSAVHPHAREQPPAVAAAV
jgi:class 3 adenylate cyclase